MSYQITAIPPITQISTAAEIAVTDSLLDLAQACQGACGWICAETGGINGITVGIQISNDGINWQASAVFGMILVLNPGAINILGFSAINSHVAFRYVRLSVKDTIGGSHGTLVLSGGFCK